MNRFEVRKVAIEKTMREHVDAVKTLRDAAKEDGNRDFTEDERIELESHIKALEDLKEDKASVEESIKTLQRVDDLGRELGPAVTDVHVGDEPHDRFVKQLNQTVFPQAQVSVGEEFVQSEGYKSLIKRFRENGDRWSEGMSSGQIEMKGTLLEGSGAPGSGSGGGFIPVPQVVPGVVETLFQRLTLADLVLSGQTSQNTVRYIMEGTATSAAAGVAEAGSKPESTLGVGTTDEKIKKIATFLTISDEMMEDAPAVQSYINGRLQLFVRIEEERQLLRGSSGGTEVQGLLTSRNVPVQGTAAWASGDGVGDKLFKGMNYMRKNSFLEPEWVLIHPDDWQTVRLLKDGTGGTLGQYFGGGPFLGAYGNAGFAGNSNQVMQAAQDSIWNKPTYVTTVVGSGTAVVGTSANAQVWRRGGLSVEASNQHSTYFQLNLIALRAEERLGLAVYRSGGFVEVHFNTA